MVPSSDFLLTIAALNTSARSLPCDVHNFPLARIITTIHLVTFKFGFDF